MAHASEYHEEIRAEIAIPEKWMTDVPVGPGSGFAKNPFRLRKSREHHRDHDGRQERQRPDQEESEHQGLGRLPHGDMDDLQHDGCM